MAGCAIGIAYKSNVNDVKPEDFVIISAVKDCPARALQAFDIPYLPACPNGKCICSWFWIHNSIGGTDQMYMTPFQCNVTNASKRVIGIKKGNNATIVLLYLLSAGQPLPPVRCDGLPPCYLYPKLGNTTTVCHKAQQPMYWANTQGNNMANPSMCSFRCDLYCCSFFPAGAQCAPIYSHEYGFPDGAQHQIFTDNFDCISNIGDTLISYSNVTTVVTSITSSPATALVSPSCKTKLAVQTDGNVVLSDVSSGKVYWQTNTAGKGT